MTVLRDRTSAAFVAEAGGRLTVWWCIFDVTFGYRSEGDEPLTRSGLNKVRVCVYHVNSIAAKRKPDIVRGHLAAMAIDVCELQVDIVAGDANGAAYSYYKRQKNPSLRDSLANTTFQKVIAGYIDQFIYGAGDQSQPNGGRPRGYQRPETWFLARLPHVHFLSNNTYEDMKAWEQNPDPEASIDCCIAHVFSWGHTVGASFHRRSAEYDFPQQAPELPPSWQNLPPNQPFPQPPHLCQDFHIRSAERPKRWRNSDLWLSNTDCDWHMPLFFTVREMTQRAKRIRTKERQMARKAVQRARQAEKAAGSSSGRTGPLSQSQGPPSWTNRSEEQEEEDQEEQEDEEGTRLDLYSNRVPEQQPAAPQPPPTLRARMPHG